MKLYITQLNLFKFNPLLYILLISKIREYIYQDLKLLYILYLINISDIFGKKIDLIGEFVIKMKIMHIMCGYIV